MLIAATEMPITLPPGTNGCGLRAASISPGTGPRCIHSPVTSLRQIKAAA
jgi:hypothetical protein